MPASLLNDTPYATDKERKLRRDTRHPKPGLRRLSV